MFCNTQNYEFMKYEILICQIRDPELGVLIKVDKYEKCENGISPNREEAILTAFAANEITREITWDILLSIALKKYGEIEMNARRSHSKHKNIKVFSAKTRKGMQKTRSTQKKTKRKKKKRHGTYRKRTKEAQRRRRKRDESEWNDR